MKLNGLKKQYVKPGNPMAPLSQKCIDYILQSAKRRKSERQLDAVLGDTVWCIFRDTPKGAVNPGTIIRIEIDTELTVYTVLPDNVIEVERFSGADFGRTIFVETEEAEIHEQQ